MSGNAATRVDDRRRDELPLRVQTARERVLATRPAMDLENAVILTHYYVAPEITAGVGDFVGDSYKLSKDAKAADAENPLAAIENRPIDTLRPSTP